MADTYPERLAALNPASFLLPPAQMRLCLLTGQSDFSTSSLPSEKAAFLERVAPKDTVVTKVGFPWHADFSQSIQTPPAIAAASYRNAQQWVWARYNKAYRDALTATLNTALQRTEKRLLIITGSCGVDLLAQGLSQLPAARPQIWAAILGPAGRIPEHPNLTRQIVIQGHRDRWSRLLWRDPVDHYSQCGHLDYYTDADVTAKTRSFFAGEAL